MVMTADYRKHRSGGPGFGNRLVTEVSLSTLLSVLQSSY